MRIEEKIEKIENREKSKRENTEEKEIILKEHKRYFYGGIIDGILGDIKISSLDKILDLIEEYEELIEGVRNESEQHKML